MPPLTSSSPVTIRNHCPTPTLSKIYTIAWTPASFAPPAPRNAAPSDMRNTHKPTVRPFPEVVIFCSFAPLDRKYIDIDTLVYDHIITASIFVKGPRTRG